MLAHALRSVIVAWPQSVAVIGAVGEQDVPGLDGLEHVG